MFIDPTGLMLTILVISLVLGVVGAIIIKLIEHSVSTLWKSWVYEIDKAKRKLTK